MNNVLSDQDAWVLAHIAQFRIPNNELNHLLESLSIYGKKLALLLLTYKENKKIECSRTEFITISGFDKWAKSLGKRRRRVKSPR